MIAAAADVQAAIETLGMKWSALLEAYGTAKADAASRQPGADQLDVLAGLDKIRSVILECARSNGLRYIVNQTRCADGQTYRSIQ